MCRSFVLELLRSPVLWPAVTSVIPAQWLGPIIVLAIVCYLVCDVIDFLQPKRAILRVDKSFSNVQGIFHQMEYTCEACEVQRIRTMLFALELRIFTFKKETILASSRWKELRLFFTGHSFTVMRFLNDIDALQKEIEIVNINEKERRIYRAAGLQVPSSVAV